MRDGKESMDAFKSLCARIGERYHDYLLIVRDDPRGTTWHSSDSTWAIGAAERYMAGVFSSDHLNKVEDRMMED